jgi:hypothetical protein
VAGIMYFVNAEFRNGSDVLIATETVTYFFYPQYSDLIKLQVISSGNHPQINGSVIHLKNSLLRWA